jgi:hypothetical protein
VKYLLMIAGSEAESIPVGEYPLDECMAWQDEMKRRGFLRESQGLRPPEDATTVRVRGGEVLLTDGPFAETKEQIGGFSLIDCEDLDQAIEVASKHPWARLGMIEVRPIWPG